MEATTRWSRRPSGARLSPRSCLAAVALSMLLGAACSSGSGDEQAAPAGSGGSSTGEALAVLEVIDQAIDVKAAGTDDFEAGTTGMALDVGDQVRSDTTGFGELGFFDGSWMRIEARAILTIEELADTDESREVATSIDGGRVWARTERLSGSGDRFEVGTPVGTASVRGTRFSIDCTIDWFSALDILDAADGVATTTESEDPELTCEFTVIEGTVVVTLTDGTEIVLEAAQTLLVPSDDRAPVGPIQRIPDELYADEWVAKNLGVDVTRAETDDDGDTLGDDSTASANLASATLARNWEATVRVVDSTDPRYEVGARDTGRWLVRVECESTSGCRSQRTVVDDDDQPALLDSQGAVVVDRITPVGEGRYRFDATWTEPCERDGSVLAEQGVTSTKTGVYEVTDLAFEDGRWVATELKGQVITTTRLTSGGRAAGCELPERATEVGFTTDVLARARTDR